MENKTKTIIRRAGRPSKLNDEVKKRFTDAIKLGATFEISCNYAGITYNTFRNWMIEGEKSGSGQYFNFFKEVKKAEASGAVKSLYEIEKAIDSGVWQAAAWKLERRFPEQYGRQRLDIEHKGNINLIIRPASQDDGDNGRLLEDEK